MFFAIPTRSTVTSARSAPASASPCTRPTARDADTLLRRRRRCHVPGQGVGAGKHLLRSGPRPARMSRHRGSQHGRRCGNSDEVERFLRADAREAGQRLVPLDVELDDDAVEILDAHRAPRRMIDVGKGLDPLLAGALDRCVQIVLFGDDEAEMVEARLDGFARPEDREGALAERSLVSREPALATAEHRDARPITSL